MSTNNNNDGVIRRRSVFSKRDYYFIFGQIHHTVDGVPMKDRWVRVRARNGHDAEMIFENEFTSKYMPSVNSYSRWLPKLDDMDKSLFFHKEEYMFFEQKYIA